MQIRVLGAIELERAGELVDLGSRKQRALLTALALHAGRPVAVDSLVALVWGDYPPAAVATSLQVYVAGLRRALEPDRAARTPATVLVTVAPGYRLTLGPRMLDAAVFDESVQGAHRRLDQLADVLPWLFARQGGAGTSPGLDATELTDLVGSLEAARRLWRGTPYVDLADAPAAIAERARLEQLHLLAVEDAALARLALGEDATVAAEAEALVHEHPLRERSWALRVLALARTGRQADALDALRTVREVLADELGIDPNIGLRQLETAVLRQDPALAWRARTRESAGLTSAVCAADGPLVRPAGHVETVAAPRSVASAGDVPLRPDQWPLVGRERELAQLKRLLDAAATGSASFAVLVGEAGIGKSRLAQELMGLAQQEGFSVLIGRCSEGEGAPPLWPWVGVLRALLGAVAVEALAPETQDDLAALSGLLHLRSTTVAAVPKGPDAPGEADAARFRTWDALARVLEAGSAQRPLLIALEDLHWADASSLRLLRHLAETLDRARLLVVATRRPRAEPAGALAEAAEALVRRGALRLELTGLTGAEASQLVAAATGEAPDPGEAERLRLRTEGNPFFLVELARLLGGRLEPGTLDRIGVPAAVRDVVIRRVDRLPEQTQGLLRTAAVIGREFDLRLLAAAASRDEDGVLDDLDPALAAGLIADEAIDRFRFAHALARDAVYTSLPAARRARQHAAIADALQADTTGDPTLGSSELARHLLAAGQAYAGRAWRSAGVAATQARARYAHEEAAALLAQAARAQRGDPAASGVERYELLMSRVDACRAAADRDGLDGAVAAAITEAERLGDTERVARAAVATVEGALWSTRPYGVVAHHVVEALRRVLRELPPGDSELRCRALLSLASELYYAESASYREALAEQGLAMARRLGDSALLIWACQTGFIATWRPDTAEQRLKLADEAVRLCVDSGERTWETYARATRAIVGLELGHVAQMWADVAVARRLAAQRRLRYPLVVVGWQELPWLAMRGDWERTEELLQETTELTRGTSVPQQQAAAAGALMCARVWQRRPEAALGELKDAFAFGIDPDAGTQAEIPLASSLEMLLIRAGRIDEARAVYAQFGASLGRDDWLTVFQLCLAAEVTFALSLRDLAASVYTRLAPYAGRVAAAGSAAALGPVDAFLALAAAAAGERATAGRHADDALALCEQWEIPLAAQWLRDQRDSGGF